MIEVSYWKNEDFRNWYGDKVLKIILKKRRKIKNDPRFRDLIDKLKSLSNADIKNILCCSMDEAKGRNWICEYLKLADFVAGYNEFRECRECISNKHKLSKLKELRRKHIDKYDGIYLRSIHNGNTEIYSSSWKKFNELMHEAKDVLCEVNKIVSNIFDYSFIDTSFRRELFKKMDVKVCPYCNQDYIQTTVDGRYLGDLDHVLPKKTYALFSMSLWNLVPSCKACNQTLKKDNTQNILNPTQRGFDEAAVFNIVYGNVRVIRGESDDFKCSWKTVCSNKKLATKINNNIKIFCLNDIYEAHKDKVIDVLRKKYKFDSSFKRSLKDLLGLDSDDDLNYAIYGCSLNRLKFKDELLSKMIYDVIKNN